MKFTLFKSSQPFALEPKISVPEIWSDEHGTALRGWILVPNGPPERIELILDGEPIPVLSWHARPQIIAKHPEFRSGEDCGFWAYAPSRRSSRELRIRGTADGQEFSRTLTLPSKPRAETTAKGSALFRRFCSIVNEQRLSVLEIGSRVVVPGSGSRRSLFPGAESYTGFDLYPDENTDAVGDAHRLSSYFSRRFDAVFSLAVFEHLAMPWVVALEINKVLRPGGLTFHQTHFTFPLHEQPADYWRFTDQGLRALFSPALGFADVETEFFEPASLHPHERGAEVIHLPGQPAYIQVAALATKAAEVDESRTRWSVDPPQAQYPLPVRQA